MDISQLAGVGQALNGQSGTAQAFQPPAATVSGAVRAQEHAPQQAAEAIQAAEQQPDKASVQQAVDQINEVVQSLTSNLEFSMDEETGINVIKVVDNDTGDVIRQIPSKEILAIAQSLNQLQGLMVREQA